MEDCILGLRDFPGIGRTGRFPELTSLGVRMLPFEDYLIFYLIREEEDAVVILRVLRSSVNYRRLFRGESRPPDHKQTK